MIDVRTIPPWRPQSTILPPTRRRSARSHPAGPSPTHLLKTTARETGIELRWRSPATGFPQHFGSPAAAAIVDEEAEANVTVPVALVPDTTTAGFSVNVASQ